LKVLLQVLNELESNRADAVMTITLGTNYSPS